MKNLDGSDIDDGDAGAERGRQQRPIVGINTKVVPRAHTRYRQWGGAILISN